MENHLLACVAIFGKSIDRNRFIIEASNNRIGKNTVIGKIDHAVNISNLIT